MEKSLPRNFIAEWLRAGQARVPWLPILFVCGLLLLAGLYWFQTRLPDVVHIAGGPAGGRYDKLANAVADQLRSRLNITVKVRQTRGSLDNLNLLRGQEVDFAFYQPETRAILEGPAAAQSDAEPAYFVSNLYAEYLLPIAALNDFEHDLTSLSGSVWCSNDRLSGDFAVTQLLLQHLRTNDESVEVRSVPYSKLAGELSAGHVNVGIVCCGLQAPILHELFGREVARPLDIPFVNAFADKHISLRRHTVPAGFFRIHPTPMPERDFETVALRAQLLANRGAPVKLVEEVTRIVLDPGFQRRQQLTELFDGGEDYATSSPEFTMHSGASHVFYPDLQPLVNPDFVEGTEGLRSFVVSMAVAIWLTRRWWLQRRMRKQEHRLDRYIKEVLKLERDQLSFDGDNPGDYVVLQGLLDKVTHLRQEALSEFTAHDLHDDNAVDCFIEMCHALSDKISGKLIRACLRQAGTSHHSAASAKTS